MNIRGLLDDVGQFVAPRSCAICGESLMHGEQLFCLHCNLSMPRTRMHLASTNRIAESVARHQPDLRVAAWFYYLRGTDWARLVHTAKYGDNPWLARALGREFAAELAGDGFFNDVDYLLPVPMHWLKRLTRGYNQAVEIARGVSEVTGLPLIGNVYACRGHATQTRRTAEQRAQNVVAELFDVRHPEQLAGKRIVVIDDVVTTGSTIDAITTLLHRKCRVLQAKVLCLGLTENI